ncbi:MAG: hypothetical protein GY716_14780, partial [bacterium]|nr:hypothetical protein [bacterium]
MGNRSRRGITGTEPSARRRQIACCIPGALVPSNDLCEFATVSTCDQADYDTKISIFCPECAHDYHVVVAANDDDPGCSGYTSMTT